MAHGARRTRRSWLQRLVLTAGVLLVLVSMTGAAGAVWFIRKIGSVAHTDVDTDEAAEGEPTNYLIVGSDTRATSDGEFGDVGGQRSDTIMIVRLDPQEGQASVLSLPRDLMVPIAGHDSDQLEKLNSAYSESNQTLIDTVRLNFGIEINHYVVIDFVGFQRLVDAVGGVSIWTDRALKDEQSGLYVDRLGCVTLNGEQALAYARSRHLQYMTEDGWSREDPFADLGRIQRQQIFIRAALAKALTIRNPATVAELLDIGVDSLTVDEGTDLLEMEEQFRQYDLNSLQSYALPVIDLEERVSVQMDPVHAPPVLAIFRGEDPNDVPASSITVSVLNGTGVDNQANDAASAFQAVGFNVGERSDYPEQPLAHTTVFHRSDEELMGMRVARHITGTVQMQVDDSLEPGHVTVATGQDFTTIHMQPTPLEQMPTTTVAGAPAGGGGGGGGGATPTTAATTQTTVPPPTDTAPPSEFSIGQPPPGVECG